MAIAIFNRADFKHPADCWYQIEPSGEHTNSNAGVVQVIDDKAITSIVNRFNADAEAGKLSHGREMLIDHEHFKDNPTKETIAYGWLSALRKGDGDGIEGRIRWTATGKAAVDGGDYRFFSTEYDPKDLVALNGSKPPRMRPTRLGGLTLTNMPNNKGGKPITNRAGARSTQTAGSPGSSVNQGDAAKLIAELGAQEQRASGAPLGMAWARVLNREPRLAALASGKSPAADAEPQAAETRGDAGTFVSRTLAALAAKEGQRSCLESYRRVLNRYPRLVMVANRELDWDSLAELEPTAKAAYVAAMDGGFKQGSEGNPSAMLTLMRSLAVQFPDLDFEARWEKAKEQYPRVFWEFVLSFEPATSFV